MAKRNAMAAVIGAGDSLHSNPWSAGGVLAIAPGRLQRVGGVQKTLRNSNVANACFAGFSLAPRGRVLLRLPFAKSNGPMSSKKPKRVALYLRISTSEQTKTEAMPDCVRPFLSFRIRPRRSWDLTILG